MAYAAVPFAYPAGIPGEGYTEAFESDQLLPESEMTDSFEGIVGRFELADGGTLFLDEIGDISLELQPKLLRAVQEQEFERLGSAKTIKVNVRIIAATH